MKKIARFIVKFRLLFAGIFVVLACVSIYLMTLVKQNYDMTKYLPDDTDTTQGLAIMSKEFGLSNNIMLMLPIDSSEVPSMQNKLSALDGVQLVTLDSYKDGYSLFMLTIYGDEYSDEAKQTLKGLRQFLADENFKVDEDTYLGGSLVASSGLEQALKVEIPIIMAIAIGIIFLVLLFTSHSWLEPVVFALVLLCAVLINMGTNVIFGEISYITFAVSAILQIALAMDYSIILLHGFSDKLKQGLSKEDALVEALAYNMRPISSSGLTTIAGLIALLFMTFAIGFDIGIVLAKGILISLLSVILFMPSLIMIFSKALDKTKHKPIPLGGAKVAKFSIKLRYVLPIVMVFVIAGAYVLQMSNVYTFSGWETSKGQQVISEHFGNSNQAVVIIENKYADDKAAQTEFVDLLMPLTSDDKPVFKSIMSWATLEVDAETLAQRIDLGSFETLIGSIETLIGSITDKGSDIVRIWEECEGDIYNIELSKDSVKKLLDLSGKELPVDFIYGMLADGGKVTVGSAVSRILELKNSSLGSMIPFPDEVIAALNVLNDNREVISQTVNKLLSPIIAKLEEQGSIQLDVDTQTLIRKACILLFGSETFKVIDLYSLWKDADESIADITLSQDVLKRIMGDQELPSDLKSDPTLREFITYEAGLDGSERLAEVCVLLNLFIDIFAAEIDETLAPLFDTLRSNFVGEEHSRIILLMDVPKEDEGTFEIIDTIKADAVTCFGERNYVAGESMTVKDISEAFKSDLLKINLVTIISILLIIAVLFRSLLLPVILVLVIQGAIWITMAICSIFNIGIFFMSYIICICIQMGATIDYGILISSNFRSNRATMEKGEAIVEAVKSAMPTIVTSGLILISAGFIIGFVSSVMPIYSIGRLLGMGTIISVLLILLLLPALLYIFDKPISAVTFDGTRKILLAKNAKCPACEENAVKSETACEEGIVKSEQTAGEVSIVKSEQTASEENAVKSETACEEGIVNSEQTPCEEDAVKSETACEEDSESKEQSDLQIAEGQSESDDTQ